MVWLMRYITYYNGTYRIQKNIKGKVTYFGSFNTLQEAQIHRDYCIQNNWSLQCKKRINRERNSKMAYISSSHEGYYQVKKYINNKSVQFASFNDLKEAQEYRDYCIKQNWSLDCVKQKCNKYDLPRYVTYDTNKKHYIVLKRGKDGNTVFVKTYKRREDAIRERDLLLKYNWDEDKLIEHDECYGSIWQ